MKNINLHTNLGTITISLDKNLCPITAQNFINYCQEDFYLDTIFHRVIPNFMVQGGGLTKNLQPKPPKKPIANEADLGLLNKRGTVAMARTGDPHSATSQFFINLVDNDFLNFRQKNIEGFGYCAFARVTEGMDIVDKIALINTINKGVHCDVPEEDIYIEKVAILEPTTELA